MELTAIKGIGSARKKAFEDAGIFSCEDLVNYFPYKYYDFSKTEPFADDGNVRLIKALVIDNPKIVKARANLSFITCKVNDEIGHTFNAVWFNQTFIKSQLYIGQTIFLYGKNSSKKKNTFNVLLMKSEDKLTNLGLMPVYHSISGIGQSTIADTINKSLEKLEISSVLPCDLSSKYNIPNLKESYKTIHNPHSFNDFASAKKAIDIETLLEIIATNENKKISSRVDRSFNYVNISNLTSNYFCLLPFELTNDQKKAIKDITNDLQSSRSMNRLLQGDVGSGKTVVAFFGAYIASLSGYQSAFIAPTEILAKQHYETAIKLFKTTGIKITLLTSSTTAMERKCILSELACGNIDILIGTHSIFSEEVQFKDLSYAVIDEQHRFGVAERAVIKTKSPSADILVMSATPIPRSLALIVYGNLDFSTILARPNASKIQTNIVIESKQQAMWSYIKNKVATGSKAYVVCSKIDEENENNSLLSLSAKNMYEYLCTIFDKDDVGLIHGKLKKETTDKVIENFKSGKIKVLVSTTIIEVGVDIPDSDIMVIVSPERFGLATLHQLRGRIGRNGQESFCFCLANNLSEKSYERVNFFKNHLNGFEIAEFDLKTRGAGTMLGTNQHGQSADLISSFSAETYMLAKKIFNEIKDNTDIMNQLKAKQALKNSQFSSNKIILN